MTSDEIEKAKNAKPPYGPSSMKMDLLAENNYAKKHENDTFS